MRPHISVIITAHNEGSEVAKTIESVRAQTDGPFEIILVDDGSTDGAIDALSGSELRVIRHTDRIGVAYSRHEATQLAHGDVFAFLDAHQRLSHRCLDQCAAAACELGAIVWPDVQGLTYHGWTGHGARLSFSTANGKFDAKWICQQPVSQVTPISAMITPGYVMLRSIYERIPWHGMLRGWGASEPALAVKAFFLGIPLVHLCGPIAYHQFRKAFPYTTNNQAVVRNHAIVVRLCFSEETWRSYWLPDVFQKLLPQNTLAELDSPAIVAAQQAFCRTRLRPDDDFWGNCISVP